MRVISLCICVFLVLSCSSHRHDYPIQPVSFTKVQITDQFWSERLNTNRTVTIPAAFKKCKESGRIDNFAIAAGLQDGEFQSPFPFDDSDVYKIIEGASYSLSVHPDPELQKYLDEVIAKIAAAQEEDGYLMTWRTINPNKPPTDWSGDENRWSDLKGGHELYNAGHLYEAAVAHYRATGKRSLLNVALKNADLIATEFGPNGNHGVPGHEEIEIGLVKLYRVSGNKKYLDLATFFLDQRGNAAGHELYGTYSQDHKPVVEQSEAVGHAVRAGYLYAGMTDVAALTGKQAYIKALDHIWNNVVAKKLYIIGGIGASREGESFGDNYELPNEASYCETCAAIANVLWNQRMFLLTGQAKYIDVLEKSLYNNVLAGVSLEGNTFFYPNVLAFDGQTPFNQGALTRKEWFDCSCCPSNLSRIIPSVPGYVYAVRDDTVFTNLYIGNQTQMSFQDQKIQFKQKTEYPWSGNISITVQTEQPAVFTMALRIPGWAQNRQLPSDLYRYVDDYDSPILLTMNGEPIPLNIINGYARIEREWTPGDEIKLDLPMPVRKVIAHEKVRADRRKMALQRGPIVYCAEAVDHSGRVRNLYVDNDAEFHATFHPELLEGVCVVHGKARRKDSNAEVKFTAIPYYAWAHRGIGEMTVWIPYE